MKYKLLLDSFDKSIWENFAEDFADYNIYQTWAYQQVRAERSFCKLSRFIILFNDSIPVMMGQIRIKSLFNFKFGYVQSGPIIQSKYITVENIQEIIHLVKKELMSQLKLHILRLNFNILNDRKDLFNCFISSGLELGKYYKKNKTFIVPLELTEDDLFNLIHRDNRRLIRKAEQLDLEVDVRSDDEYFPVLHQMYLESKQRKGFSGIDSGEFWDTHKNLSQKEKIEMIIIKYENSPIAIHATSHLGNTSVPIITVNNLKSLELNVSNYLWWLAFLRAKKYGMSYYDMGGYDENENPKGFLFKKRMGGEPKEFIPPFDCYRNKVVKYLWHLFSWKYYV